MEKNDTMDLRFSSSERNSRLNGYTRIMICPTTGGNFELTVFSHETIHGLKTVISRKLKIPYSKIYLLFRERLLKHGTLRENNIVNNSKITLLPTMESGFSFPHEDAGVMQALESLSDSQVSNFLSGRAPLVLAMRLGDHMMLIQLQLSTSQCGARRSRPSPVMVPPPGQISVQDHQEIPSPTLGKTAHHQLHQSRVSHEFTNFPPTTADKTNMLNPGTASSTPQHQFYTPPTQTTAQVASSPTSGAVIESMQHLGGGVYSGKFSGTLEPTLHDSSGHPRRDISTIIHILKDLLGASPQYRQHCLSQPSTSYSNQKVVNPDSNNESQDTTQLRAKVRRLQKIMEERKNNRRARRSSRAPYQWSRGQGEKPILQIKKGQEVMEEGMDLSGSTASYHGNSIKQTDTLAV